MEFCVNTWIRMAYLNMDRNWRIDTLTVRPYEGNISLTWNLVYKLALVWLT